MHFNESTLNVSPAESMVINSLTKELIEAEANRMGKTQDRLDLLGDDWKSQIKNKIIPIVKPETALKLETHISVEDNPFKYVIRQLSTAYKTNPVREFTGSTEKISSAYSDWYKIQSVNEVMELAQRYMNALNDAVIYLQWREGEVCLQVLAGNILIVEGRDNDPTIPEAVYIRRLYDNKQPVSEKNTYWIVWTREYHYMLTGNLVPVPIGGNENMINPYGKIPMVYLHRELPTDSFFDWTSGQDLVDLAVFTGRRTTMDEFARFESGFKQPAVSGDNLKMPDDILKNPDSMIKVDGIDVNIQVLDWQIDLEKREKDIRDKKERVAANYGINAATGDAKHAESGIAFVIENQELQELREKQIKKMARAEHELFELKKLIEAVQVQGIPVYSTLPFLNEPKNIDKTELSIKFPEPDVYVAPEVELKIQIDEIKANLASIVDVYMKRNQIHDREDAIEKLKQIQEDNRLFAADKSIMDVLNAPEPGIKEIANG